MAAAPRAGVASTRRDRHSPLPPLLVLLLLCGSAATVAGGEQQQQQQGSDDFVRVEGVQLRLRGAPFYVNGWNSYWLMAKTAERFYELQAEAARGPGRPGQVVTPEALAEELTGASPGPLDEVREVMAAAAGLGMTVCRTWAFSDGGYHALQIRPGIYDPVLFKALDLAVAEARAHDVKLILSLANDLPAFGGKAQYMRWTAAETGHPAAAPSDDAFYVDAAAKRLYKRHVAAVVNRTNSVTGVAYRDDPTIMAWELINEPRCSLDPSGATLRAWVDEMAAYVKQLDRNHLVTIGSEGFYGPGGAQQHARANPNPGGGWAELLGADFLRLNAAPAIDFASVHAYPDNWVPWLPARAKLRFLAAWIDAHVQDAQAVLGKPVLVSEFAMADDVDPARSARLAMASVFRRVYASARAGGAAAGSLLWQFRARNMDRLVDKFSVAPAGGGAAFADMARLIAAQSCRLQALCGASCRQQRRLVECPVEVEFPAEDTDNDDDSTS